jgi:hypothetical protein
MNKNTLLILIVIFIFSSELHIVGDIVRGLLYILILIQLLNYFNSPIAKSITTVVTNVINYDNRKIQKSALSLFNNVMTHSNDTITSNKKFDVSFDDKTNDNRNLLGRSSNNRNLYN